MAGENDETQANPTSVAFQLKKATEADTDQLRARLDELNDMIRENGRDEGKDSPIRFSSLARAIHYLALDAGERERKGTGTLSPQWAVIIERYNAFRRTAAPTPLSECNDDNLRSLCTFATRRTGNQSPRFYAGLAAFVAHEAEQGSFGSPFMRMALPRCEISVADACRRVFLHLCSGDEIVEHPEVSLRFAYAPENVRKFEKYRRLMATDDDGFAHFVVYRPSRSEPARLMKSYLAISKAQLDGQTGTTHPATFKFVHIYRPPARTAGGGTDRVSLGRVLTFDQGVYLVGGQRDETTERRPFQSLKVLALPWVQMAREDTLLSALLLSSNYSGEQIVSRAAIRTTNLSRSNQVELGSVNINELSADLSNDSVRERAAAVRRGLVTEAAIDLFPLACAAAEREATVANLSSNILKLTNNGPAEEAGWDLGRTYARRAGRKTEQLTKAMVSLTLETTFGSNQAPKYFCAALGNEGFDFWDSLRFGPLALDI